MPTYNVTVLIETEKTLTDIRARDPEHAAIRAQEIVDNWQGVQNSYVDPDDVEEVEDSLIERY